MIVTNVIYCLKDSQSSVEFRKLCDKDQLIPNVSFAMKNDGRQCSLKLKILFMRSFLKE